MGVSRAYVRYLHRMKMLISWANWSWNNIGESWPRVKNILPSPFPRFPRECYYYLFMPDLFWAWMNIAQYLYDNVRINNLSISQSVGDIKSISQLGFRESYHSVSIVWSHAQKVTLSPWCRLDKAKTVYNFLLITSSCPCNFPNYSTLACRLSLIQRVLRRASYCAFPITEVKL